MEKIGVFLACLIFFCGCESPDSTQKENYSTLRGKTMGTTYSIVFKDLDFQAEEIKLGVDSVLVALNQEVSTYIGNSVISRVNKDTTQALDLLVMTEQDSALCQHFVENFKIAKRLFGQTNGFLDPTVMPLVNYWGFGYTGRDKIEQVDSTKVESLLELIDFSKISLEGFTLTRENGDIQLDFSAVAKGYGVDLVGWYLESQGVNDYLVEIGGETLGAGKNREGSFWKVGINTPKEGASVSDYDVVVSLENKALATSGNYRIFYENEAGSKYAHIINPKTGYSEQSTLLSVSVFAPDCATADGFATGFMTMGLDAAMNTVESMEEVEAAFIFINEKEVLEVAYSSGLKEEILIDKTKTN
jgi:thiamine biosynthesis lipoprotein